MHKHKRFISYLFEPKQCFKPLRNTAPTLWVMIHKAILTKLNCLQSSLLTPKAGSTYDASTRKRTCKPGQCKHKRNHKKKELFFLLLVLVLPSLCCACELEQRKQLKTNGRLFFSADKQTNVSSATDCFPKWRWKLRRNTAPAWKALDNIALFDSHWTEYEGSAAAAVLQAHIV